MNKKQNLVEQARINLDKEKLSHQITLCKVEKLERIIKEIREYIEHAQNYGKEKILYINGNDILEILDKVGDSNKNNSSSK